MDPVTTASTPAAAAAPSQKAAISADFQMFLKMLTTQMQNQDPLNPIDSSDYAVQLATFSGVEQQMRTNQLLTGLSGQFGLMGLSQLSGWVGQEARAAAPVAYDGAPVTLSLAPDPLADNAVLVVRDAAGALVSREPVPLRGGAYQWLGADAAGNPLPAGQYGLTLESSAAGEVLRATPVEAYHRIAEARMGPAGVTLLLEGGAEIAATSVTALRQP